MGNCCTNLCSSCSVLISLCSPSSPAQYEFSNKNDNNFLIPRDYTQIILQLKEKILPDETSSWINYQKFLISTQIDFEKLLGTLRSYANFSAKEMIPFETIFRQELNFPKKFPRKFMIDVQRIAFNNSREVIDIKTEWFKSFVEIEIYPDEKNSPDRVIFFQTKTAESGEMPEWNELFIYEFENERIRETGKFCISLYNMDSFLIRSKKLVDQKFTFMFSELNNQLVNEKNIKLKDENNKYMGDLLIRVQIVYNYERFLAYWINEIENKLEIIERILKINEENSKKKRNSGLMRKLSNPLKKATFSDTSYIQMTSFKLVEENERKELKVNEGQKKSLYFKMEKEKSNVEILDSSMEKEGDVGSVEFYENNYIIK